MERLEDHPYCVQMVRRIRNEKQGTKFTSQLKHEVTAVSKAQAQRKAETDMPGWKVVGCVERPSA